jgi:hypothetical protein
MKGTSFGEFYLKFLKFMKDQSLNSRKGEPEKITILYSEAKNSVGVISVED